MTIQDAEYLEYNSLNLICQDFFYKEDGYVEKSVFNKSLYAMDNDLVGNERSIRIYGTQEQLDLASVEYKKKNRLMLDEVYNYKVEPKGSYWNDILQITDEQNQAVIDKLKRYNKLYNQKGRKALILRTR
jgi:hypothetical protein|tara:strand:+ start:628 stop:1017 length:390 start_codon:yes stop_codon:yes gene_type:complete